ncbi:hypothetical protein KXS11_09350 [Plantibacter flavus]|uniref:hypothetical protein n=1 Tax=Plantibacter flavus TaxID=150123 RepID=UPI003F16F9DF
MDAEHEGDAQLFGLDATARVALRTPPAGFVAERTRLAAEAADRGDTDLAKAIRALRKPSVAAWALNVLAAERIELFARLEALGSALGAAQAAGDAATLRSLGTERRSLVAELVNATIEVTAASGAVLSAGVVESVRQSLQAASADADVAEQVASGLLVEPPTSSGSGWGSSGMATGLPSSASDAPTAPEADGDAELTGERRARLRARLADAERDGEVAAAEIEAAEHLLDETATRQAELLRDRADIARRLTELDADLADIGREHARQQREVDRLRREGEAADTAAERVRAALED